jgi:glycosyltransferase involved in cell wall biosynthesis
LQGKAAPLLNVIPTWIEKRYLDTVDGFVFNSRTTCDSVFNLSRTIRPHVIAPPGGDRWGRPGVSPPERATDEGPMRLIYVGLVIPRKGLLPLIEALAQVRAQNWRLDVVGSLKMDRRYANRCRKLSAHLGLAPRIRFRGEIADSDLMEIMAEAHVLCMPFAYEGFGITTAEAMRCGVPVMGSTAGATRELINHGVTAFFSTPATYRGSRRRCHNWPPIESGCTPWGGPHSKRRNRTLPGGRPWGRSKRLRGEWRNTETRVILVR